MNRRSDGRTVHNILHHSLKFLVSFAKQPYKRDCILQKRRVVHNILQHSIRGSMGWLRLVGSFKLQVSFAEYSLFYRALLQKRLIILRSLLVVATPYRYIITHITIEINAHEYVIKYIFEIEYTNPVLCVCRCVCVCVCVYVCVCVCVCV